MSDANRVSLRYVKESTAGTTPGTPTLTEIKLTGTSDMGFTPQTVTSNIIRSDRQENDLTLVNGSVGGQFDTEIISSVHDELIRGVLFSDSDWSTETEIISDGTAVAFSISSGNTSIIDSDTNGTLGGAAVGEWIEIVKGAGDPEYYRVVLNLSANNIVVEGEVTATDGSDITITQGSSIINGVTQHSYTFEKAYLDHSPVTYEYVRGMVPGTFSISASASAIVTGSFGFTGRSHEAVEARIAGSSESDVSGSTFNASSNIATIGEGGDPGLNIVTELSVEIENNLRELNAIGTLGAFDIGSGTINVSGSLQTYFQDKTLLDKLIANTQTSLSFGFTDGAGESLIIDMPAIKFSEGVPDVPGKNEDVMLSLGYQAFADTTLGYTIRITRFSAA